LTTPAPPKKGKENPLKEGNIQWYLKFKDVEIVLNLMIGWMFSDILFVRRHKLTHFPLPIGRICTRLSRLPEIGVRFKAL